MPRGKSAPKRVIAQDPIYNSELLAKFINTVMRGGKKALAQNIVYRSLDALKEKKNEPPLPLFEQIVSAVRPQVEVRSKRVGGANYQVPLPVPISRQYALAFRWIISAASARKGGDMGRKLAAEFLDVLTGTGGALKKREDVHRMAEANKAFAHFARFSRK